MKIAIEKIFKRLSLCEAFQCYPVPKSTLYDQVKKLNDGLVVVLKPSLGPLQRTFTDDQEKEIISYILEMERNLMPLTKAEFLKLIFQAVEILNNNHRFQNGKAGEGFYKLFLERHPQLSLRCPENISVDRARGFNADSVNKFYLQLQKQIETLGITTDVI